MPFVTCPREHFHVHRLTDRNVVVEELVDPNAFRAPAVT
jgi:hypothetical protein